MRALHAVVQAHGGYDAVTKGRLWARIAGGLAIPLDYQNAGTVLRYIQGQCTPNSLASSASALQATYMVWPCTVALRWRVDLARSQCCVAV